MTPKTLESDPDLPRPPLEEGSNGWKALLDLQIVLGERRSRLVRRPGYGPLYVQKPFYPEGSICHLYLLHPPGGVVGGDQLESRVAVRSGAQALLTTPAATKFMRSAGDLATARQQFTVESEATLEWLPLENIVFDRARALNTTQVRLSEGARFIGWDITALGRPVNDESLSSGSFASKFVLKRRDSSAERFRNVLIDVQRYAGSGPELSTTWGLSGYPVTGTLYATPADEELAAILQKQIDPQDELRPAITLINGVLVARCRGTSSAAVHTRLRDLWQRLRPLVCQRVASAPAIWRT